MRKMLLFYFLLCLLPMESRAYWLGGHYSMRFERDIESKNNKMIDTLGFLIGHRRESLEYVFEYSYLRTESGTETLKFERKQNLFLLQTRYYPYTSETYSWYPYLTPILGLYQERVTTTLLGMRDSRVSKWLLAGGADVGVWGLITESVRAGAELRAIGASDFDPKVLLDLSLRLGYEF